MEAESRIIRGSLFKFSEGRWTIGTKMRRSRKVASLSPYNAAAWVKGRRARRILREPGVPMPEREELGDCDGTGWENGSDGQPRDPWQSTRFVHLVDPQTAEAFTFSRWGRYRLRGQSGRSNQAHAEQACGAVGRVGRRTDADQTWLEVQADVEGGRLEEHGGDRRDRTAGAAAAGTRYDRNLGQAETRQ